MQGGHQLFGNKNVPNVSTCITLDLSCGQPADILGCERSDNLIVPWYIPIARKSWTVFFYNCPHDTQIIACLLFIPTFRVALNLARSRASLCLPLREFGKGEWAIGLGKSIKEQSCLGIFNNPSKAFLEIRPGDGTASDYVPFMGVDDIELQPLNEVRAIRLVCTTSLPTCWISASSIHPLTSVLLANTSKLAPESLY